MRGALAIVTLPVALTIGCGDTESEPPAPAPCPPPTRLVGERCLGPGVAANGCPAGTLGLADGGCRPAGMLAEDCADGFVHAPFAVQLEGASGVAGSCEPILPASACGPGLMAVPGDTVCRPMMDCGSGKWGDIPLDAGTAYVDRSFAGMSDGSAAAPWTSIGQAVSAAAPGTLLAIAAGSYVEDVNISGKALRLWGVCPDQVELVGTGAGLAALEIRTGASGSEVRGLAVRGAAIGVLLSGSEQVVLERLWVHDNADRGINVQSTFGATSFTVRASLVERNYRSGVFVTGSEATVDATVVRGTLLDAQGVRGVGISIQAAASNGAPSLATVRASLVEQNHDMGVFVAASEATVEATVVRGTLSDAQGFSGRGIGVEPFPGTGAPATVMVRASHFEQNHDVGVYVSGSEATVEATVVRGTLPDALGLFGRGIGIQGDLATGTPSRATVRSSLVEQNHQLGVFVGRAEATVEATVVRDTVADGRGLFGRGINIQEAPSQATLRATLVEQHHDVGVFVFSSDASIEACRIAATQPDGEALFGDGLLAASELGARVFVDATRIDDSTRAGLSNFGASVSLGATAIACSAYELEGEPYRGANFVFEDRGGNACGCPEPAATCRAVSNGLAPPEPVP